MFKKLYRNSSREKGTLKYFLEKLSRRRVTVNVKHFEDCEQLFLSVGNCFLLEAFLEFFNTDDATEKPMKNVPDLSSTTSDEQNKIRITSILDKFLDEYIFVSESEEDPPLGNDGICLYSVNMIKSFIILADFKDAVAVGNGEHLSILHKQLLIHFFTATGFNEYAIEMLISIMQSQILLSQTEAHKRKWASTVNWSGGERRNVEIDLFQENRNKDMKFMVKAMGANKTDNAIGRASKASGGVKEIVEAFEKQTRMHCKSSSHSHKSSAGDEKVIMEDLRSLRPFKQVNGREFESFKGISHNPASPLDENEFVSWINRHKNNILKIFLHPKIRIPIKTQVQKKLMNKSGLWRIVYSSDKVIDH